jgi:alcohol dehydrogenase
VDDGGDIDAREAMAWADTLGGLSIASAGVTLPHGLGMQISGHCPHVSHGQSLAVTYPEFTRFTWRSAVSKFATVGRLLNPQLFDAAEEQAAERCCREIDGFLKRIGMWVGFQDLGVSMQEIREIADVGQVLPDYKNNPRVASIDEMYEIMVKSFQR